MRVDCHVVSARHPYVVMRRALGRSAIPSADCGVSTGVHYCMPINQQRPLVDCGYDSSEAPVAESLNRPILSMPCYPELENAEEGSIIGNTQTFREALICR